MNASEVLRRELRDAEPGSVRMSPILTDPYQGSEARFRITRGCLEALAALGWLVATSLDVGFAACGLVLGLAPVALLVHREAARRAIERDVAREIAPRIARLLERTGGRLSALAPRARRLRLDDLARLLDSPVLAMPSRQQGPYR